MKNATSAKTLFTLTALATALTAASGTAQAQVSSATVLQNMSFYGILDVGVENLTNVGAGGDSITRVPSNTNTLPSRLGIRGFVPVDASNKVVYVAEIGLDPGNGNLNQGGRLFGRQVYVGLSGNYGTFSIGRQYTMTFWSTLDNDTLGGGIYGTGSLDSYLPNARADNSVAWTGKFNGLTLGAQYSFGRDTVNAGPSPAGTNCPGEGTDNQACRQWSLMVKYDTPTWGVALSQDKLNGRNVGASPDTIFGGLNTTAKSDTRTVIGGWVKLSDVKVGLGVVKRKNDGNATAPDSDLWYVGASVPLSQGFTLAAQYAALRYSATSDLDASLLAVRGTFALFKGAEVYAQLGHISNGIKSAISVSSGASGSNPAAGKDQTGIDFGIKFSF